MASSSRAVGGRSQSGPRGRQQERCGVPVRDPAALELYVPPGGRTRAERQDRSAEDDHGRHGSGALEPAPIASTRVTPSALPTGRQKPRGAQRLVRGGPVCRELATIEERFGRPLCAECGAAAEPALCEAGVVIACGSKTCGHVQGVEQAILQRLVGSLSATCFSCGGQLTSRNGVFGNYLKCASCGTNSSWLGISSRLSR